MAAQEDGTVTEERLVQAFARAKTLPSRGEPVIEFLHRQTHIYLQSQELTGALADSVSVLVPKASVVYLYSNSLTDVSALSRLSSLQMLYLQDNQLTSTSPLHPLTALQKLILDGNCIEYVSGLENMRCLKVLHLSRQRLSGSRGVTFDAASLQGLSGSLATLRAASCGMQSISGLSRLHALQYADFSRNNLVDPADCLSFVTCSSLLHELDLRDNAVSAVPKFLDQVIAASDSILCLNGSDVKAETRVYLQQLFKRGVRAMNRSTAVKRMDSDAAWTAECRVGDQGSGAFGGWPKPGATSPSSGSRLSGKGSRRQEMPAGNESGMPMDGLSMACVGVALGGPAGFKEVTEDEARGQIRATLQRPGHSFHAAGGPHVREASMGGSGLGNKSRPGTLAEGLVQPHSGTMSTRQKKAPFRT